VAASGETQLVVFDFGLLTGSPRDPRLAWRITLGRRDPSRVFVDTGRGTVLLDHPLNQENGGSLHGFDLDLDDADFEAKDGERSVHVLQRNTRPGSPPAPAPVV
jgi:hypothetical protein